MPSGLSIERCRLRSVMEMVDLYVSEIHDLVWC